jgi:hemolysin activation/secretion protein
VGNLIFFNAMGTGRFGPSGTENVVVGGRAEYFLRDLGRHIFFVGVEANAARNLDPEKQLLLGGDSGLRGYPLRYQAGDRRALITIEQRFYTDWHLLKLLHVGGALFMDAGAAWFADEDNPTELGLLRDVGFGLRLGSSRSSTGTIVHIDVAFPLDGLDDIESPQFFIKAKDSF